MKAQYRTTEDGQLILVYVNSNKDGKKWYECYSIYDKNHFEAEKDYILKCKPQDRSNYVELSHSLGRYFEDLEIINRLPKL